MKRSISRMMIPAVAAMGLALSLGMAGTAHAGVIVTENQEASGIGWPETITWNTYTANYSGTGVGVGSGDHIAQTYTPDAAEAGTIGKFFLRYSNSDLADDSYLFEIYETADTAANPLVVGTKILSVPFTLTEVTTASKPVLTLDLTGASQMTLNVGQGYAFEIVGNSTGSMTMYRRSGSDYDGQGYKNGSPVVSGSKRDLVVAYSLAVPEPTSGAMALLGLGGLLMLPRRKRRSDV